VTAAPVLAALLGLASRPARAAAPACDSLERHGRVHREWRAVPRPWEAVRQAVLAALEAQPANAAAARAAAFWRRSGLALAEAPVSDAVGGPAGSELDLRAGLIVLDARDLAPLWRAWPTRRRAAALRLAAQRLAPVVVHELAHARLRDGLGEVPPFREEELLADAEETLYLWGLLERDPDALGLRAFDARVEPGRRPRASWWKSPPQGSDDEVDARVEAAARRGDDPWLAERWRLVRGLGGGYERFRRTLADGGVLGGVSIFELTDDERRAALADTRALRQAHQRCLATAGGEEREDLQGWVRQLSGEELAYEDSARLSRVAGRYRSAMDDQRRDLDALRGAPAR
jgi:hypothetical protein